MPPHAPPTIIAIDGPAGSGKSTVAREVAHALGLVYLDTGAMYRAVTLRCLELGVDPRSGPACARVASELELAFDSNGRILIDGMRGEPAIRSGEVTRAVSEVSAHPEVRAQIVAQQRAIAAHGPGLVAEGRDTTTVVFPDASAKFYLVASPAERARRRAGELGTPERESEIRAEIERRDAFDSTRAHSPLRRAPDALLIDSDELDASEVVARILAHVSARA